MDTIARLIRSPLAVFALSSVVAIVTAVATLAFGAPQETIVLVAWGLAMILTPLLGWSERRLGRR